MPKATAKKKLWKAFATYIRLRDAPNGYGNCISCNKMVAYPNDTGNWHAGHYYPRSVTYGTLYFDEYNVNGQCRHCNTYLEGNKQGYEKGLKRKYGQSVFDHFDLTRAVGVKKCHDFEYNEIAKHYRKLVRELKKKKGML